MAGQEWNNIKTSLVSSDAVAEVSESSEDPLEETPGEATTVTESKPSRPRMKIPNPLIMIWLATILLLMTIKPAASQLTLSPNLTVYDTSGLYSGKPPMVKTIAHPTMH